MPHILHDISVYLWAMRNRKCDRASIKFAYISPISINQIGPRCWQIRIGLPSIHLLNSYELEKAYFQAH